MISTLVEKKKYKEYGKLVYEALKKCKDSPEEITYAEEITYSLSDFIEKYAQGTTVDSGTVSAGAFVGSGTLTKVSCDTLKCINIIKKTCDYLKKSKGDESILSKGMSEGFYKVGILGDFTYNVVGTATMGMTVTSLSGDASGTLKINKGNLDSKLSSLFKEFGTKKDESISSYRTRLGIPSLFKDYEESFAYNFASTVQPILEEGKIETDGESSLSGSKGFGKLTFKKDII